tara:strand:- start:100 stop:720 length:621 start_codon:yes stop_codon:yes gene_type:complete
MRLKYFSILILILNIILFNRASFSTTMEEFIFDDSKPIHIKILEALPKEAIIQVGPDDAKNTVIEFMDYFCGYCKKIHPELLELAEERNDLRVVFLQHPILNQNSLLIAKMVIAAKYQNKGLELHNAIFSIEGSLTQEKLARIIDKIELNEVILQIDTNKPEVDKIIQLTSFLAGGIGARGTPTVFVNENYSPGYVSKAKIIGMLK